MSLRHCVVRYPWTPGTHSVDVGVQDFVSLYTRLRTLPLVLLRPWVSKHHLSELLGPLPPFPVFTVGILSLGSRSFSFETEGM